MKINKNKKRIFSYFIGTALLMLFLCLLPTHFANAGASETIAEFLSWIVSLLINMIGKICTWVVSFMVTLFEIQDMDTEGVAMGWAVVRDVCNMFFILVFLIIAFATILRIENYSAKRLLPKLLLMAILINFSKFICLWLIDISNVITLTFASAFTEAGSGNFADMLGMQHMLSSSPENIAVEAGNAAWINFGSIMLALVFISIALCVFLMFVVILIGRIVMFWVLIVLSPIAFFAYVVPGGRKYFDQWMGEFSRYLIVGPVLAFFTWLSLMVVSTGGASILKTPADAPSAAGSEIGAWENMSKFILAVGLLVGTLKITASTGAMGASVGMSLANKMKSKATNVGKSIGKGTLNLGKSAAKNTGKLVARNALTATGSMISKTGWGKQEGSTTGKVANVLSGWGGDMKERRKDEKETKRQKTLEKIGIGKTAGAAIGDLKNDEKIKNIGKAVKGGALYAGGAALTVSTGGLGALAGVPAMIAGIGTMFSKTIGRRVKGGDYVEKAAEKDKVEKERKKDFNESDEYWNKQTKASEKERAGKIDGVMGAKLMTDEQKRKDIKRINAEHDTRKTGYEAAAKQYKEDKDKNIYRPRINNVQEDMSNIEQQQKRKILGNMRVKIGTNMEQYDPNAITIAAGANIGKEHKQAEATVQDLTDGSPKELTDKSYYKIGGPSSTDRKVFDLLNNSSKKAADALMNMVTQLNTLKGTEARMDEQQLKNIYSMKRWMAFEIDSGKSLSAEMLRLKNTLDDVNTSRVSKDGKDKVDELRKST
jgi:hypothetical protein